MIARAELAERVLALPRPLVLGLDVDGTLAPIVPVPSDARAPAAVLRALARIEAVEGLEVALLTGRDLASLRQVAPVEGVWRAVEHGRVRIDPEGETHAPPIEERMAEALRRFEREAERLVARGARLESKPAARAIHVRELEDEAVAEAILQEAARAGEALGLHARRGRAVVELEVEPGDKGEALAAIASDVGAASAIFVGDDLTDVPALRRARELGGLAIFVISAERPEPPTEVDAVLEGPGEVAAWLDDLATRGD